MGAESGPRLQAWGCSRKNVSVHDSSALAYPAAAPGTKCVWLTQALSCLLISSLHVLIFVLEADP